MSYFGTYLGAVVMVVVSAPATTPLEPIESPLAVTDPAYVDHTTNALKRLPLYAREKAVAEG